MKSADRNELARRRPDVAGFERQVDALERLLSSGRFVTAGEVAIIQGCSKKVAHKRIRALERRGHKLQTERVREGARGPESIGYAIIGR